MRRFFYQANFCAECGNALRQRRVWWPRYFCDVCARQVRRRATAWRWLAPLGLLSFVLGLVFATHDGYKSASPSNASLPTAPVSAFDASAQAKPLVAATEQAVTPSVFCGARTQRGKPCRRLVQPGQRCAQHRGRPSMVAPKIEDRR